MEFVSRKQMTRSTNYRRPLVQERRPAALPSAFAMPIHTNTGQVPKQPVANVQAPVPATPAHTPTVAAEQNEEAPTVPVIPLRPALVAVPVAESVAPSAQPVQPDITEMFEKITNEELSAQAPAAVLKRVKTDHSAPSGPSTKKRVMSAAVFVAALVGMVAMGYDLFFAPHPAKPSVSHVSQQLAKPTPPKPLQSHVTLANNTAEPNHPKQVKFSNINLDAPVVPKDVQEGSDLAVPADTLSLEWATQSAKQGEYGTMVLIGSAENSGALHNISEVKAGKTIEIERGDGTTFVYTAKQVEITKALPRLADFNVSEVTNKPLLKVVGLSKNNTATIISAVQQ